ncbi:hypothetical protein SAMN05216490_3405 [Mucilaginibacter mallensis]|uniref:Uncharacterized protein n=1 Tax=Mucilaginibacter mallensis TaxID=652787 RepID=A0A1H2A6V2_MUCMA|nr:hypothetical protein [Mucilaginibacter mallensis]SDT41721.1 hypothetical protein SAMN05216490_3405 [Mucilaginibacter mallensis]
MQPQKAHIPKIVIKSIGGGLLLMALFTMAWAGIASGGLPGAGHWAILVVFGIISISFIIYGIKMFTLSKYFSTPANEKDRAEAKRLSIWYGVIFGAEGIVIPIVAGALVYFHKTNFIVPAIAMIVGLHFYPMARIFKRTIDYYLATWTCVVALSAIIAIMDDIAAEATVLAFLGVGVALATSCYGFYMIYVGKDMTAGV